MARKPYRAPAWAAIAAPSGQQAGEPRQERRDPGSIHLRLLDQRLDVVAERLGAVRLLELVQQSQQAFTPLAAWALLDGRPQLGDQPFVSMSMLSHSSLPQSPPPPRRAPRGRPAPARSCGDDVGSGRAASMPP